MFGFTLVWLGQIVSVLASSMTGFALTIWAYQETGSATALGLVNTAFVVPFLIFSPIAGVMVDRYNRKLMMMLSDFTAFISTAGIFVMYLTGNLKIWHIYIAVAISAIGNCFQWPAYSAAITTMLPKEKYSRANGMMSLVESGPGVLAPILAGALMPFIKLEGILLIDVITFVIAVGALLLVYIPQPEKTVEGQAGRGNMFKEAAFGFRYIFQRKPLISLLLWFLGLNFVSAIGFNVLAPFILSKSNNDSTVLGAVETAFAIGSVGGGLLVSLWGGFKRRIKSIFVGETITGSVGILLFGLMQTPLGWIIVAVLGSLAGPFTNGASQAIWQSKVAPDVQGRVFSARRMIAWFSGPITPIIAGLLADHVTEPAMRDPSSGLARAFGWLVGVGAGSGMALQFIFAGLGYLLLVAIALLFVPNIRNLEDLLPDHDQMEKVKAESTAPAG